MLAGDSEHLLEGRVGDHGDLLFGVTAGVEMQPEPHLDQNGHLIEATDVFFGDLAEPTNEPHRAAGAQRALDVLVEHSSQEAVEIVSDVRREGEQNAQGTVDCLSLFVLGDLICFFQHMLGSLYSRTHFGEEASIYL